LTLGELAAIMDSGQTRQAPETAAKASYLVASASKALRSGQALGAQVLIVDPPRRGLEDEVLEELCKPYAPHQPYLESSALLTIPDEAVNWANDVQTLIYVSCGFDALASDCDRLLSSRGAKWTLHSTRGYILFPGSDHVETVAIFQRK
jgi:23S rRNA (uracil1939-C5)-methyltransferase